jgi:thiol-disulfide isomerase/thioredoxin
MLNLLNQFSYLYLSGLLLILIVGGVAIRSYRKQGRLVWKFISTIAASLAVLTVMGFFALRPGSASVDSVAEVQQIIQNDRPTVIQFFSNYCIGCMSVESQFDAMATQISSTTDVLRVDIHTDFGRELREALDFSYTPEFILYDINGDEVWRGHQLPPENLLMVADVSSSDS